MAEDSETPGQTNLKLGLELDDALLISHLHPLLIAEGNELSLTRLAAKAASTLKLSGRYYGTFSPDHVYQPKYLLAWSFAPAV